MLTSPVAAEGQMKDGGLPAGQPDVQTASLPNDARPCSLKIPTRAKPVSTRGARLPLGVARRMSAVPLGLSALKYQMSPFGAETAPSSLLTPAGLSSSAIAPVLGFTYPYRPV